MINYCPQCAAPVQLRLVAGRARPTCSACGFIVFADPKVAAAVLAEHNGMLLLVRRAIDPGQGLWCFPGGYVDFGEDPLAAARRECVEEAGLELSDLQLLDVAFNGRVIVITYTAHAPANPILHPADDADAAGWFAPDALPPLAFATMHQTVAKWARISGGKR